MWCGVSDAMAHAQGVDLEGSSPVVRWRLVNQALNKDASVVDQDVYSSVPLSDGTHRGRKLPLLADVDTERCGSEGLRHWPRVVAIDEHHLSTSCDKPLGGGAADTRGGPRDHRHAVVEREKRGVCQAGHKSSLKRESEGVAGLGINRTRLTDPRVPRWQVPEPAREAAALSPAGSVRALAPRTSSLRPRPDGALLRPSPGPRELPRRHARRRRPTRRARPG